MQCHVWFIKRIMGKLVTFSKCVAPSAHFKESIFNYLPNCQNNDIQKHFYANVLYDLLQTCHDLLIKCNQWTFLFPFLPRCGCHKTMHISQLKTTQICMSDTRHCQEPAFGGWNAGRTFTSVNGNQDHLFTVDVW